MAQGDTLSPSVLMDLIGTPQVPDIIDVCIDEDFQDDSHLIPTARRHPHTRIADIAADHAGRHVVVVCQKGRKLSHGAAALLRARGVRAQALEGGNLAWRDAGLPRVPAAALPAADSLWVTGWTLGPAPLACVWIVRRFVDPRAEVLFVPSAEAAEVASKFSATAMTADHDARPFDTMLTRFGLTASALEKMADVIRAADADDRAAAPQAAGLRALCAGLSRGCRDDLARADAGLVIYDALYQWARAGAHETDDRGWETAA